MSEVTLQGENPSPKQWTAPNGVGQQKAIPFWVVVPTLKPGLEAWADWIAALKAQDSQPQKVIIVDSGSDDGSLALTQSEGFSLFHVKALNFDHGGTRQWALAQALQAAQNEGISPPEVVVFITQDALLAPPSALQNLVQAFANPQIGAAYGRQLAKPHAPWMECHARAFNYPELNKTLSLSDRMHLGFKTCFFSNAFGAYRLSSLMAQGGLPAGLPLGEDTFMAAKLLLSGQSLQYQASAAVYHSHNYNRLEDFQRMFDTGVFHAQNNWLLQSFGKPEGEGIRLLKSQWAFLKASAHSPSKLFGLLQMVLNNAVKLCGYKIGTCYRFLPLSLKLRFAMNKSFLASAQMIQTLSLFQVRVSKFAILLGDVIAFAAAFTIATLINVALNPNQNIGAWFSTQDMQRYVAWTGLVFLGLMLFLMRFQHYSDRRPFWDELGDILRLVGSLALLDMTLVASTRWNSSRLWWLLVWVLAVAMIVWGRMATRWILKQMGLWIRQTIIIGHGENAQEAAIALESEPRMGFEVVGYVNVDESSPRLRLNGNALQNLHQLETLAAQPGVQWVIALEHAQSEQREHWLRTLTQWGATDISVIPAMRGVPLYGTDIAHFFSHEVAMLRVRNNLRRWPARLTKRLFDSFVAAFLLVLISPLMLFIAMALKIEGGSVLFAHQRIGKNGRKFYCYKFRSMVPNAEQQLQSILQQNPSLKEEWHKEHKLKDDPRVSKVGDFLRRTSLDELPQLFNVLKSEMSLVGPRPIVQDELQKYGLEKSYYLMVRPGMTGLWQVSGRNNVDYETRVYLDAWYVKNWSLWYDLAILFKTIKVVFWRNGAY